MEASRLEQQRCFGVYHLSSGKLAPTTRVARTIDEVYSGNDRARKSSHSKECEAGYWPLLHRSSDSLFSKFRCAQGRGRRLASIACFASPDRLLPRGARWPAFEAWWIHVRCASEALGSANAGKQRRDGRDWPVVARRQPHAPDGANT